MSITKKQLYFSIETMCNILEIYVTSACVRVLKYKMLEKAVCMLVKDGFLTGGHVMVRTFEYFCQ